MPVVSRFGSYVDIGSSISVCIGKAISVNWNIIGKISYQCITRKMCVCK